MTYKGKTHPLDVAAQKYGNAGGIFTGQSPIHLCNPLLLYSPSHRAYHNESRVCLAKARASHGCFLGCFLWARTSYAQPRSCFVPHPGLEKLLMQYDLDQDGHYTATEVRALVGDFMKQQAKVKNLKRVVFVVLFLAIVACGAMLGIVVGANEASKESHVNGNVMVGLGGGAVQVEGCESFADMRSFLDRPAEEMAKLDFVEFGSSFALHHPELGRPRLQCPLEFVPWVCEVLQLTVFPSL